MEGDNHAIVDDAGSEKRYHPYVDAAGYDSMHILPPLTVAEKPIHDIAHACVRAVEARYVKKRKVTYPPKSRFHCSVHSLIQSMTTYGRNIWDEDTLPDALKQDGIEFVLDEATEHEVKRPGAQYHGISLTRYTMNDEEKIFDELDNQGPVIGFVKPWRDFYNLDADFGRGRVYSAYADEGCVLAVTLIGRGKLADKRNYFIAQNCFGEEWGDRGEYRVMATDVYEILVPVLP